MSRRLPAFTLVEVLAVVTIVGVLVALLIPAVQQARVAARRCETRNHLRQIGIALHSHHNGRRSFPFAAGRPRPGTVEHLESAAEEGIDFIRPQSWAITLLPYLEEGALASMYERFCLGCPPEAQEADIVDARIRVYNAACGAGGGLDYAALSGSGPEHPDPARRNDRWFFASVPTSADFDGVLVPEGLAWIEDVGGYTIPVRDRPIRMAEVLDGLSRTLVMTESGDYSIDDGATWITPRYSWPYVSDVARYSGAGAGPGETVVETSVRPRSRTAGGVLQALAGDCSVQSVAESIEPGVMKALATRADGDGATGH